MKATRKELPEPRAFKPFVLEIEVETEEGARALYAIFNNTNNSALLKCGEAQSIKNTIGREYYLLWNEIISNGITGGDYYKL